MNTNKNVFQRPELRHAMYVAGLLAGSFLTPGMTSAGEPDLEVPIHKGTVIRLPASSERITVGSAEIADIRLLDPTHLYVLGQHLGSTNVVLCNKSDCFRTLKVEVTHDLESLKSKIHQLFPNEHPKVFSSQGSIVLTGPVSSLEKMNAIVAIANTFARPEQIGQGGGQQQMMPGGGGGGGGMGGGVGLTYPTMQVINLMQVGGPQQVMIGITVAEMARTLARNLSVDFTALANGGDIKAGVLGDTVTQTALNNFLPLGGIGGAASTAATGASGINPATLFFRFIGKDAAVRTVINAARANGMAKVLAEPNLTVISGQDAEFVSGGEFPVPVSQFGAAGGAGGGISVQFKEYGVILKFLPVVLDSGRLSLKTNITVSEVDYNNAVNVPVGNTGSYAIPSLLKRGAVSMLEMDDGQTMGLAGLINDRTSEIVSKFPGIGDIPILGQLFTSQSFQRNETELLILVTPHLVKPLEQDKIRLPTDDYVEPSDVEFYWMGRTEALEKPTQKTPGQYNFGGLRGHFGQNM